MSRQEDDKLGQKYDGATEAKQHQKCYGELDQGVNKIIIIHHGGGSFQ